MEQAVIDLLLASVPLRALVGSRITWATRQQGSTLPAVVLTVIDDLPDYVNSGRSDLSSARLQVDCWGGDYTGTKAAARAVTDVFDTVIQAPPTSPDATSLQGAFKVAERDSFEQGEGGEKLFRMSMDFIIWHAARRP